MADLKINTAAITECAGELREFNDSLRKAFEDPEKAVNTLSKSWNSPSASGGIGKFFEIKNAFEEPRYQVLNNYVNYLLQAVGEGYELTEEANVSLADAFK